MEVIIAISGASGVQYGIRLLEILSNRDVITHLIITASAKKIIQIETERTVAEIEDMASAVYDEKDFTAPIASGSHRTAAMVIAPCSMRTVGAIATGSADNLVGRAADVCLKEGRTLILMPRETPLSRIHLENLLKIQEAGAVILPACPGFYSNPTTIEELVNFMAGRVLDLMGMDNDLYDRWGNVSGE
ncbi:MAG: UbiX family flavin prenyltransferase [Euryarchaeota archaeon]|nr:UbiX family flavin prenyltransferase [Euryarchaeota archaeon]